MAKFMVVCIGVDDGEVKGVYGMDEPLGPKHTESLQTAKDCGQDVPVQNCTPSCLPMLYTHSSPGCRYVYHGGRWVMICD